MDEPLNFKKIHADLRAAMGITNSRNGETNFNLETGEIVILVYSKRLERDQMEGLVALAKSTGFELSVEIVCEEGGYRMAVMLKGRNVKLVLPKVKVS